MLACHAIWYCFLRPARAKAAEKPSNLERTGKHRRLRSCVNCLLPCLHTHAAASAANGPAKTSKPSSCCNNAFLDYIWQHGITAALVICFEFYSIAASTALGMLMCVKLPAKNGFLRCWVLDIRLQCPVDQGALPGHGQLALLC